MIIAVDFDGTCVTHDFPNLGKDIGAAQVLKQLTDKGHQLILWTMRSDVEQPRSDNPDIHTVGGQYLQQAVDWFEKNDIPLWGIQTNPDQHQWTHSPKAYAQLYIDDAALGCPLIYKPTFHSRSFVNWAEVEKLLIQQGIL